MKRVIILLAALSLVSACAHKQVGTSSNQVGRNQEGQEGEIKDISSFRLSDPEGPKVLDQELETIPTEVNPSVEMWIKYYQGRGRGHMERYLAR